MHVITDPGPNAYFEMLGRHTDRSRFELSFVHLGGDGPMPEQIERLGLRASSLGADRRRDYPRAIPALARRLRRERIDVVHTHLLDGSAVGLTAARIARTPVAIFTGHHSHEIPMHDRRSLTMLDRVCARWLSDATIAPSEQMRATLLAVHGVPPRKVVTIHHGFELDRFDPARVDRDSVRAELGLEDRLVIGSIGRFYWIKNQEAVLRAFAAVAPGVPDATLVMAGAGDSTAVKELSRELGIDGRLLIVPFRSDVPELLAAFDLFVHPALAESFGQVIVEAMAMSRPVVSTPVGIAPEVIDEGKTGFLASGASVEAISEALRTAFRARERWPEIGRSASARAREFPAAAMVRRYEELYTSLLEERA
jgi:glycosyltransferase involved in cell wall biosynthesis